jgi:hypothetical protein
MERLDLSYYAGLLTAAQYHGAAHQRPQTAIEKIYDSTSERALRDFIEAADPSKLCSNTRGVEWLFRLASIANDGDDPFGRDGVFRSAIRANNDQL